jgi:hypothetical protein
MEDHAIITDHANKINKLTNFSAHSTVALLQNPSIANSGFFLGNCGK